MAAFPGLTSSTLQTSGLLSFPPVFEARRCVGFPNIFASEVANGERSNSIHGACATLKPHEEALCRGRGAMAAQEGAPVQMGNRARRLERIEKIVLLMRDTLEKVECDRGLKLPIAD
ncbi:hypothetical protein NDU88_004367 [Pleurodeles waltl]|uniref:Uncharacterized protein n=1 Tax=Pleurodeles waltl TaxID=8319 RepID=A0AAV7T8A6_PLEWA|nr:hypothetical protein NDU88_004367 [Pleurodeles waltl]